MMPPSPTSSISDALALDPALRRAVQAKANHGRDWARANREQIERAISRDLAGFVRLAWPILEPTTDLKWGAALDAICLHLEAVADGRIKRLLINCPPGMMKSLVTGVFFPAWLWGPKDRASARVLGSSYSDAYAARDARRMRSLVLSPWYQRLWGDKVSLTRVAETSFANSATGSRDGVPFSRLTGGRADVLILDDPHSVSEAESEAERERTVRLFRESVTTRLNDPEKTAIVIICQRLHEADIPGVILSDDMGYDALILPMRYDPARRCRTSIGFEDWRERPGQLLFPERFPREVVDRDEKLMGSYATAAQFQQTPSPRGGGLIQVDMLRVVKDWPRHARVVRSWDLAATEEGTADDPDYTAGVKVAYLDGRATIVDVSRGRLAPLAVEQRLRATAILDGHGCAIVIEREGGSSGKITAAHLVTSVLAGYEAREQLPTGSKVARSRTFAAAVEAGNVDMLAAPWNDAFVSELREFPRGAHDDQVDAAAAAFNFLSSEPEFFVL